MIEESPRAGNMTGCFLAAHPQLTGDPNFRRTIIYLTSHSSEEGAHGVIMNRPLGKRLGDFSEDELPAAITQIPVFEGGPVERDRLFLASLNWNETEERLEFLSVMDDLLAGSQGLAPEKIATLRGFLGYAGWSRGQLEEEIARQSWVILPASRELVDLCNSAETWKACMRKAGPVFHLLSEMPDDPSQN